MLQHEEHPRPFGLAGIFPAMHRTSLHHHITAMQDLALAGIQHHLDRPLDDNAIVQALGPVDHWSTTGAKVHHASDRAVRVGQAQGAASDQIIVGGDVGVIGEGDRELRSCIRDVEGQLVLEHGGPEASTDGLDDGFAVGLVVTGEVSGHARQVRRELARVHRARARHDDWFEVGKQSMWKIADRQ